METVQADPDPDPDPEPEEPNVSQEGVDDRNIKTAVTALSQDYELSDVPTAVFKKIEEQHLGKENDIVDEISSDVNEKLSFQHAELEKKYNGSEEQHDEVAIQQVESDDHLRDQSLRPSSVPAGGSLKLPFSRPQSSTSYYNRARSATPKIITRLTNSCRLDAHSTLTTRVLREAVYEKWYFGRLAEFHQRLRDVKRQQAELQKEQHQEKESRRRDAHTIYQAWKEQKQNYLLEEKKKAELAEERKREEERLKLEKQEEARMAFLLWKAQKDEILREQRRQKLEEESRRKEREEKDQRDKQMDAQSSYNAWKQRKNEEQIEAAEAALQTSLLSEMKDRDLKMQRDTEAIEAFQVWLGNKEFERHHRINISYFSRRRKWDERPPWLPPGQGCYVCYEY